MRSSLGLGCALLGLFTVACGGGGSGGSADPTTEPLTAAAEIEEGDRVDTRRSDHEEPTVVTAAQPSTRPLVAFVRIGAGDAEDGSGNVIHATQRVAVDLDAHAFPPRALDPVLHVGALRFTHYGHPSPGVLRFALDDIARLPIGAEMAVEYEGDAASRRVVLQSISADDLRTVTP